MQTGLYVDRFYEMDPQFEDLLPEGSQLKEGMIVLLEDGMMRGDVVRAQDSPYEQEKIREVNRWCTVTNVKVMQRWEHDDYGRILGELSPLISFVAVYADGTKRKRTYDSSYAWLVKLDSIDPSN